jgi:hypothetical protein
VRVHNRAGDREAGVQVPVQLPVEDR